MIPLCIVGGVLFLLLLFYLFGVVTVKVTWLDKLQIRVCGIPISVGKKKQLSTMELIDRVSDIVNDLRTHKKIIHRMKVGHFQVVFGGTDPARTALRYGTFAPILRTVQWLFHEKSGYPLEPTAAAIDFDCPETKIVLEVTMRVSVRRGLAFLNRFLKHIKKKESSL